MPQSRARPGLAPPFMATESRRGQPVEPLRRAERRIVKHFFDSCTAAGWNGCQRVPLLRGQTVAPVNSVGLFTRGVEAETNLRAVVGDGIEGGRNEAGLVGRAPHEHARLPVGGIIVVAVDVEDFERTAIAV